MTQLTFFRMPRPPDPLEFETQCALADLLEVSLAKGWWYSAIPSGELRTKETARRLKAMGVKPGMSDLLFIGPDNFYFLELKRRGMKLRPEQSVFLDFVKRAGGFAEVADTF